MAKQPSAAAMRACDNLAECLGVVMEREEKVLLANLIDEEFDEATNVLQQVWDDYANHGDLKESTKMRIKSVLAYMQEGIVGLDRLFNSHSDENGTDFGSAI